MDMLLKDALDGNCLNWACYNNRDAHYKESGDDANFFSASKIGLPAPCRGDVALQHAKIGSSVNSPNGRWAPTGGERAVVPSTLPVTCETSTLVIY